MKRAGYFPFTFALSLALHASDDWPQFRGPTGDGHSDSKGVPLTWSEKENVKWKAAIPGEGWSSPVILGRQIWMQTALNEGQSLRAVCVDRDTGKLLHNVEVFQVTAPEPKHALNSHASPTPVVEPGRLYVFFGMYGAACLDTASGKVLWKNTDLKHDHDKNGPGSSPVMHGNLLLLNCDGTELRYVAALDKQTGKRVWKTDRSNGSELAGKKSELRKAYQTPLVINVDGQNQLVSMGAFRVGGYDVKTGREIWFTDIPGYSNVPRPVQGHGLVYVATGFTKPELWAIRPNGRGDISQSHVAWKVKKQVSAKPSPILVGDQLYLISDGGILTCLNAKTGMETWVERLRGEFSASPVYVDGHLILCNHDGQSTVVKPGDKLNVVAENKLETGFMASPAVSGKALFLRTKTHLYRIEK